MVRASHSRLLLFALLLAIGVLGGHRSAAAQSFSLLPDEVPTLELLITWRAASLTPPNYAGRVLPTRGGALVVSLQALQGGQPVNIANDTIRWTVNGVPIPNSDDKTTFQLTLGQYAADDQRIQAVVEDGQTTIGKDAVVVSIANPRLVLNIPYPNKVLPREEAFLEAIPYFLNVTNTSALAFSWIVGQSAVSQENLVGGVAALAFSGAGANIPVWARASDPAGELSSELSAINYVSVR